MCKPGYTWNETLGKCLMGGYGGGDETPDTPETPKPEMPSPDDAVKQEKAMRMSKPKAIK